MKKVIGKYLFEVVVIFIGITASFLFEEWRQGREKDEKAIAIMKSLVVELERNDSFIMAIDTSYIDLNASIEKMLRREEILAEELSEVTYMLLEGITQIRLKDISSFIHGFSSADQLNILNRNKEIFRYLTYMESLLNEHELISNDIGEYASEKIWPLLHSYGKTDNIINYQKDFLDLEIANSSIRNENSELMLNEEFVQYLKWSQFKILRLMQINGAIHRQVDNIVQELNKVIEQS